MKIKAKEKKGTSYPENQLSSGSASLDSVSSATAAQQALAARGRVPRAGLSRSSQKKQHGDQTEGNGGFQPIVPQVKEAKTFSNQSLLKIKQRI
jgi:hypothetical protein